MCYDQYNVDQTAIIGIIEILFDIKVDNFMCNNINIMMGVAVILNLGALSREICNSRHIYLNLLRSNISFSFKAYMSI